MADIAPPLVGAFYRAGAYRYADCRRVIAVEDGNVLSIWPTRPSSAKWVKLRTFVNRYSHLVAKDDPPCRHAHVVTVGKVSAWHVFKYDWPMDSWYSLDSHAISAEPPAAQEGDDLQQFDIRDLPRRYLKGLEADVSVSLDARDPMSPNEALRRQRVAHAVAIARALTDRYDILGNQQKIHRRRFLADRRRRDAVTAAGLRAAAGPAQQAMGDDDIPF